MDCDLIGIQPQKEPKQESHIYPNPAINQIIITQDLFNENKGLTFCLYDLLGREVLEQKLLNSGTTQVIDVTKLTSGTYMYVLLRSDGSAVRQQLMIAH
jgi:hypothetical protein